jgi:transglutaminase-like putative cysteine protease
MSRERFDELEARAPITTRFPAGTIKSDEQAQKALDEAAEDRQAMELRYILDQRACYPKFLVADCLEAARDRKRLAEKRIKQVEYEAKVFQRQATVDDRDRSLADQRAKDEQDAARRQQAAYRAIGRNPDWDPIIRPLSAYSDFIRNQVSDCDDFHHPETKKPTEPQTTSKAS